MISHASLALVAILRSSTRRSRPASRSTPSCQIFCSMVSRLLGQSPARGVGQYRVPVQAALDRAWDLRKKIVNRVRAVPASDNLQKIWDATIEDVEEGSTLGPFTHPEQVSELLRCEDWIPTQRFEVVLKNRVCGCDSATTNLIDQITIITEKLQLPSTDTNVAALRRLRSAMPGANFAGWVLDERKAYRPDLITESSV